MIWKTKRSRDSQRKGGVEAVKRRTRGPERLEARRLFAADPIHIGVVYLETDYLESDQDVGSDSRGDRFILSFTGGAADTALTELRIRTDKDGDGITVGDPIFDTALGGRGKNGAHNFQIVRVLSADGRRVSATAEVEDGGQELILRLSDFRAGDRLEFTIDVDEVLRNAIDLAVFNDRLDVITSGQEFQDSILQATFDAPHYETSHADAVFLNDYGDPAKTHGLNLPPDEGTDVDSRPNRSAAAVASTTQTPKPIDISGNVWLDNDLDNIRQPGEAPVSGVQLALWRQNSNGNYADTGFRATTDVSGRYIFPKSLGLQPGTYRVVETQPTGLYSVAAVPGTVDGQRSGSVESKDVLTGIEVPLGDTSAIHYDFAEAQPATLSGFVYQDNDNDGRREAGETGIAGVRIQLVPINTIAPQSVLTVTSAGDGAYTFTGLAPGSYEVIEVDQPSTLNDGFDSAGTVRGKIVGVADNPGDRIRQIFLAGADPGIEYNFGEVPFGSISGFVYLVAPGQDCTDDHTGSGNNPIPGVRVELQDKLGFTVAVTTTGADGRYRFNDVPVGKYRIVEFTPADLLDGESHIGRIDNVTSGISVDGGLIQDITMTPAGVGVEYNFCEAAPASISGYVYHDQSDDGRRDPAETPIAGTDVSLIDANGVEVATTRTDASGRYQFDGLLPGDYSIVEHQPIGLFDGIDSVGTIRGQVVGRLAANDKISVSLKQGDIGVDYNFGELMPASLFGRVHADVDGDCELDDDEQTLAGVTIRLLNAAGTQVASTTTNVDGRYSFENLEPGQYTVVEEQPDGFFEGDAEAGSAGGQVVGANRIDRIDLGSGETAVEYDFCERPPAEINGSVFGDRNGDLVFDSGEPGIAGVRVELYNDLGEQIATTNTNPAGHYRFTNLPAGSYTVREIQPAGWLHGGQRAGSAGGDDSQPDVISRIPVSWGQRLIQYDFPELEPASISGVVFVDGDGDCVQDASEPALAGVTIELRDAGGRFIRRTITDASGRYQFDDLLPGRYQIFEQQPDGVFQGGQIPGTGNGEVLGEDLLGTTLGPGDALVRYNYCELAPSSIRGYVFVDDDDDCQRDPNERVIEGVTIELRDSAGKLVARTTTDAGGQYLFEGLASGRYQIFEQQPDGLFHGGQRVGTGDGEVLGIDLLGVNLASGQHLVDYNFCEHPPSSIRGYVFVDDDDDCQRDPGERVIEGVAIELRDSAGKLVARTTTDADGKYLFEGLASGRYQIFEQQPDGLFHGGQRVGTGDGEVLGNDLLGVNLGTGQHLVDYNFCEHPPSSIRGYVFVDDDRDCQRDPEERALEGVAIELRDSAGKLVARTATDAGGEYLFEGLAAGRYQIFEQQPDGLFQGGQIVGTGDGEVLADDLLGVNLGSGQHLVDYNFCELPPSTISGRVWRETDLNQRFEPGESPIPGVLVELIDRGGDAIARTHTDLAGNYEFTGLAPGVYSVRELQPSGLFHGGQVVGDAGGDVGGDDLLVGITLTGGTQARRYDFPEVPPAIISGHVFQDGDAIRVSGNPDPKQLREYRDGSLTDDDLRLGGVTLELRNVLGLPFDATRALAGIYNEGPIRVTTDANGYYEFPGLRPGTYHVYQVQPDDYLDGLDTPGTTGGIAVNPADEVADDDRITIQTLALSELTDPRNDAILNISLVAGGQSLNNNFSEIVIADPQIPLIDSPPDDPQRVSAPIETFDPRIQLVAYAEPRTSRSLVYDYDEWAVSWHLSVINGGHPPGTATEDGLTNGVSVKHVNQSWTEGEHARGKWTIATRDGTAMDLANPITLGEEGATALAGDFNGDGIDEAVLFVAGQWFVDFNGNGRWDAGDLWIQLGTELDRPVVGDWDGDGKDDIGIFGRQWQRDPQRIKSDPGLPDPDNKRRREVDSRQIAASREDRGEDRKRLLRRGTDGSLRADAVDHIFQYGEQVDTPLSGDWNGDGIDQIAVFRGGKWRLDADGDGRWHKDEEIVHFGQPGDEPIIGDFNGDEIDEIGVVRGDLWIIDSDGDRRLTGNDLRIVVPRPSANSQPVVGDFDGDGKDEPGYYDEAA